MLEAVLFERYVNSKDNQTKYYAEFKGTEFERYVNSKDNQTSPLSGMSSTRLRDM